METDGRRAKDPPVGTVVFAARKMGLEETLWSMKTRVYQDWGGAKEMIYLDFRKFRFTSFFIQRETAEQKLSVSAVQYIDRIVFSRFTRLFVHT